MARFLIGIVTGTEQHREEQLWKQMTTCSLKLILRNIAFRTFQNKIKTLKDNEFEGSLSLKHI